MLKKVALGLSAIGFALSASAAELVCVNGDELMKETTYAKELKKMVEEKIASLQKEMEEKIKPIQEKLQKLQKELQSGLLSEEAKKQKEQEFIRLQQELRRYQIQYQQEAQKYLQEEFMKFDKLVKAALKALAQTEGFKAVVNCRDLLYYDPSLDITKEVAKALDQLAKTAVKAKEGVENKAEDLLNKVK